MVWGGSGGSRTPGVRLGAGSSPLLLGERFRSAYCVLLAGGGALPEGQTVPAPTSGSSFPPSGLQSERGWFPLHGGGN